MKRVVVVGVGNAYRRDDAAGLAVVRRLREAVPPGTVVVEAEADPMLILEHCAGAEAAVVIDAVSSGGRPGTVYRLDAGGAPLPERLFGTTSTHAFSVGEVVELARALGTLPPRVTVFGIEGRAFEAGEGLSPEVAAAVERVAAEITAEAAMAVGPT
ncbi:MAG TPA: hydrogenase maturation protease [bacterium]|nr:hydrogenase maturation protease [bacterium]